MGNLVRCTERGMPDPIKDNCVVLFDHFTDEYALTSNEPVTGTSPWIGTALSSGVTVLNTDAIGGWAFLQNDGTNDNSGSQIQSDIEAFGLQLGKDLYYGCRMKAGEWTESHFFAGFGITDTTFLDGADGTAALANTASLGFFSPDGDANLYLVAGNGASTIVGQTSIMAPVAGTVYVLEFVVKVDPLVSGKAVISVFVNGQPIGQPVTWTGLSTTEMAATQAYVSGAAGAATVQYAAFDWVCAIAEL